MANISGQLDVATLVREIEGQINAALYNAVEHTISLGERHAKRLAPVRKVTEITKRRGRPRALSNAEIASLPASIRRGAEAIKRGGGNYYTMGRRSQQSIEAPEVVTPKEGEVIPAHQREGYRRGQRFFLKEPGQASFLTSRGRAELMEVGRTQERGRNMTAIYTHGGESTLGGRLRGEITAEMDTRMRRGSIIGRVISPTPYARYVEFPTSRTEAQPYMRPALKAMKRPFIAAVYRELKRHGFRPEPI